MTYQNFARPGRPAFLFIGSSVPISGRARSELETQATPEGPHQGRKHQLLAIRAFNRDVALCQKVAEVGHGYPMAVHYECGNWLADRKTEVRVEFIGRITKAIYRGQCRPGGPF